MSPADERRGRLQRQRPWWWVPGATTVAVIGGVLAVLLWQLHLNLLLTDTTTTGGDTGAHVALPAYLQSLLSHGHVTGWDPGWYDGFPVFTFYFVLPDLFAAVLGWVIPYNVAFKLVTISGSLLLPIAAWACGRLFRLRPPIPTVLAALTLPFLFDSTFTIYGGNLFSTLAGEYSYSLSLSFAVLFLGLFARAVREGSGGILASFVLTACILSHIVPAMFALTGAVVLTVIELLPSSWALDDKADLVLPRPARRQVVWRAGSSIGIGLLLSGWWLIPFLLRQSYATSMGYRNVTHYWSLLFPEADAWALGLAALALVVAVVTRSRFGLTITAIGIAAALGLVLDPQGSLYNVRLLPLWIVAVYLLAGWGIGALILGVARYWRSLRGSLWEGSQAGAESSTGPPPIRPWEGRRSIVRTVNDLKLSARALAVPRRQPSQRWGPGVVSGSLLAGIVSLGIVIPPFFIPARDLPVTVGPNQVTDWAQGNYAGYERTSDYGEYHGLIATMSSVGRRYGCGRAMWEYSDSEERFGTTESLMLLPYWTKGCIDSMEGLLFESSATTPYHFINQAELSKAPSDPEYGLPYGPLNVSLGVKHLQLLGVRYFMAESVAVETEANADPNLQRVASSGPWTTNYNGKTLRTTWMIYEVRQSALVVPLRHDPLVLNRGRSGAAGWLRPSLNWYLDPTRWSVELAQSGPISWRTSGLPGSAQGGPPLPPLRVSGVAIGDNSLQFTVSKVGVPVLVKVSYFPNWHASGADGPWRVAPNLMVVVPTAHTVRLSFATTPINELGAAGSGLGVVALIGVGLASRRRKGRATAKARG